jgi:glucose dehydrogenase
VQLWALSPASTGTERVVILTAFAQMIELNAKTGRPIPSFGVDGRVNLVEGLRRPVDRDYYTMTSPPVIVRDVIVVGSSVKDWWGHRPLPPGDVRGFDVVTGRLLWTFHTVAQEGEAGVETWENRSWKETGNTNVWAPMSADEELGYVYLPVSTPTNDFYGSDRPGDGLYGDSLVCLDALTGQKIWHYQLQAWLSRTVRGHKRGLSPSAPETAPGARMRFCFADVMWPAIRERRDLSLS